MYENNMADQALVVGRLKVLQSIEAGGITEIKQSVDAIKKQTNIQLKQQEEYWKTLSNDSVISSVEKQTLKREMENVRQSYAAIIQQATSLGYTSSILQDYIRTYETLRDYIYTTLKLFDDMTSETKLNDRDYFNSLFSNYFFLESFVLLAITKGILDTVNIRVLNSLLEEGTEGETALYHGGLYQYTDGRWKSISTGNYKGAKDELPAAEEDSFFLASETFISTEVLMVNGEELYVNGDQLGINMLFQKGFIYYVFNGQWKVEADKTNWRYVAAFADVLNVTGELPQIFQDAISDLQNQIDQQQTEIDSKVSHVPVYFGASSTIPSNAQEGDFFTFTGSTYGTWYNSMVYKYENNAWQYLDPDDTGNRNYYMQALTDILACNNASSGFFATIFASSFFANAASIENLSTKTIYLKSGGNIQSEETAYIANQQGLKIDADGNIDANGSTHIGKSCVIDGNTTIEGNALFKGIIEADTGIMHDVQILGDSVFSGDIYSGPLELSSKNPTPKTVTFAAGTTFGDTELARIRLHSGTGLYGTIEFTSAALSYAEDYRGTFTTLILNNNGSMVFYSQQENVRGYILDYDLSFTYNISSDAKTFKLTSLPTMEPQEIGVIWNDRGTLKIKS